MAVFKIKQTKIYLGIYYTTKHEQGYFYYVCILSMGGKPRHFLDAVIEFVHPH